jgi:hypothetical protein
MQRFAFVLICPITESSQHPAVACAFCWSMEGVCSVQLQAQDERSLGTHYSLLVAETHDYREAIGLRCQYK